jgi:phosphate transport system protein
MREVFQNELKEVQDRLVEIASDVTNVMKNATIAFTTSDVTVADQAIASADAREGAQAFVEKRAPRWRGH